MTDQQTAPTKPAPAAAPKRSRGKMFPLIVLILAIAAFFIWRGYFANPKVPDNIVVLSGRIEGDDSAVAPKTTGRILEIKVREGDVVKAGDTIAVLDDAQLTSREEAARAAVTGAEARAKSAGDQIAVYEQQLQQNELSTEQAKVDSAGRVRQAESDVAAAESDLVQQEASLRMAQFDDEAYKKLAKTGAASERQATQASSTAAQQVAAVAASRRRLEAAHGALTTAQANLSNPGIRGFQSGAVRSQINQQRAEIANAAAATQEAQAQLKEAQENRKDLIVTAPSTGRCSPAPRNLAKW